MAERVHVTYEYKIKGSNVGRMRLLPRAIRNMRIRVLRQGKPEEVRIFDSRNEQ